MDASTLVIAFLLVTAAALAGYLMSQWSSIRKGSIGIGWIAISIGVTLLLTTAAVVVLTVGLLPGLRLSPTIESAEHTRKSTQSDERMFERKQASREPMSATIKAAAPTDRGASSAVGRYIAEGHSKHRTGNETASAPSSREAKSSAMSQEAGLVFSAADPWAATNCVYASNPDPADLTRWRIENGCGAPVGVVLASCSNSQPECGGPSWDYQIDGMILPGKVQRPVIDADETWYGSQIRYVACMVAAPLTIELIGQNLESRSSPSWLQRFEAARNGDECLTRVRRLSDPGRDSGKSIDALLGADAPGKVHPGSTSDNEYTL
ncbi:hypothetical protein ACFPN2_25250 [Steroidobacter flavus]|uniref:Uncharacterized protein n=1 Tax=Steroidobacter flavus TaxID=1842136 RepID=A0ABV8SZ90_9GAMM